MGAYGGIEQGGDHPFGFIGHDVILRFRMDAVVPDQVEAAVTGVAPVAFPLLQDGNDRCGAGSDRRVLSDTPVDNGLVGTQGALLDEVV